MNELRSWSSYWKVRRLSRLWGNSPSGLSHYDAAVYLELAEHFEHLHGPHGPYWIFDLGTYFGHSAFSFLIGANKVSPQSQLRVLSVDLFDQPAWLHTSKSVQDFVRKFGSTGLDAIGKHLATVCAASGMQAGACDQIKLLQQDVTQLSAEQLLQIAPKGFVCFLIDCGKLPDVMNSIMQFCTDSRIAPKGSLLVFQDFFDWHAPWNLWAFWKLLKAGNVRVKYAHRRIPPMVEIVGHTNIHPVCDKIEASQFESWCTPYTSPDNELRMFDEVTAFLQKLNCHELAVRVQCLKTGALLRAGRLADAETWLNGLDSKWPPLLKDGELQNAYARLRHLKTGNKDLTIVLESAHRRRRQSAVNNWARALEYRLRLMGALVLHSGQSQSS